MKAIVLALGLAMLVAGCCAPCGSRAVGEKLEGDDGCAPVRKPCDDVVCVPAPTNIGLDGW